MTLNNSTQEEAVKSHEVSYEETINNLEKIFQIEDLARQKWALEQLAKETKISSKKLEEIYLTNLNTNTKFEPLDIQDFLASNQDERQWIIAANISEATTLVLFADGGVGKTLLAYDLCKSIATGQPWNGYPTKQGKVLIIQTDEPEIDTSERLNIAGFSSIPKGMVKIESNWQFSQIRQLQNWIERERPLFVMIDSLTSANRDSNVEEKDAAYGSVLYKLRDIANEYKCSIMVLHHENKSGQARGTTAIRNNVSEVWKLSKSDDLSATQRILDIEKSRSGCNGQYKIELNVDDYSWKHQGEVEQKEKSLKDKLLGFLEDQPGREFNVKQLADQFKNNVETVRRNLEQLRKKGMIDRKETFSDTNGGRQKLSVYFSSVEPCTQAQLEQGLEGSSLGVYTKDQQPINVEPDVKALVNPDNSHS